jgi:peroxiredoxin Q/BCP
MLQLQQDISHSSKKDIKIVVIGPEDSRAFSKFWDKHQLQFIGIPDPEHKISKVYGQEVKLLKLGRMPAQVLIDKNRFIQYCFYGNSMADIPKLSDLLSYIQE